MHTLTLPADIEGVVYPPGTIVAAVPVKVDAQWFVDHPAPDGTDMVWWVLTDEERISTTRRQITEAISELQAVMDLERRLMSANRVRAHKTVRQAQQHFDESPEHAARFNQAKDIRNTLHRTRLDLERIHEDLTRKLSY
jgi:hypothetical protein